MCHRSCGSRTECWGRTPVVHPAVARSRSRQPTPRGDRGPTRSARRRRRRRGPRSWGRSAGFPDEQRTLAVNHRPVGDLRRIRLSVGSKRSSPSSLVNRSRSESPRAHGDTDRARPQLRLRACVRCLLHSRRPAPELPPQLDGGGGRPSSRRIVRTARSTGPLAAFNSRSYSCTSGNDDEPAALVVSAARFWLES